MIGRIRRETGATPLLPIIGKIKCGIVPEGKNYPQSLDYFIATDHFGNDFVRYFDDAHPDKPNRIPVAFISDNHLDVCVQKFEIRDSAGRRWGYGDGEEFMIFNERSKTMEPFTKTAHPDIMSRTAAKAGRDWEEVLELTFVIPSIRSVVGQWRFTTKGVASSIPAILGAFDYVQAYGTVVMVPFDLVVEKVKSQKPGDKSLFPVVNLIPNLSTGHLEMLRTYLGEGHSVKEIGGMLTESKIEDAIPKLLPEAPDDEDTTLMITDEQYARIGVLIEVKNADEQKFKAWVADMCGSEWPDITEKQANEIILALKSK